MSNRIQGERQQILSDPHKARLFDNICFLNKYISGEKSLSIL